MDYREDLLMKKTIIAGVMATLLAVTPVFADNITVTDITAEDKDLVTVDPGITPDSIFYAVDTLIEDIELALTSFSERKAEIMLKIAEERQAEANKMVINDKLKAANKALEGYAEMLEKVQEIIGEIILSEESSEDVKKALIDYLENVIEANSESEIEVKDEELKVKIEEKIDNGYLVANVVKGLDIEKVKQIRIEQKLGYGVIAKVFMMADATGKPVDEIVSLFNEGKGYGQVAKELGLHPSKINGKKIKADSFMEIDEIEDITNEFKTIDGDLKGTSILDKEEIVQSKINKEYKKESLNAEKHNAEKTKVNKILKENKNKKTKNGNNGKQKDW